MNKIILFVNVQDDGAGDFHHLADICAALPSNPKLQNYALIPIVGYGINHKPKTVERFRETLQNMGLTDYFVYPAFKICWSPQIGPQEGYGRGSGGSYNVGSSAYFNNNALIRQHLSDATHVLIISSYAGVPIYKFLEYVPKNAKYTFIGEHEWDSDINMAGVANYHLGLRDKAYGIKIKQKQKVTLEYALQIFAQYDAEFYRALVGGCAEPNASYFTQSNMLFPAYFSKLAPVLKMIELLAINEKMSQQQNININLTGEAGDMLQDFKLQYFPANRLKETNVRQVELYIKGESEPSVVVINSAGVRSIRIFTGFYLSNTSFAAINQQAGIAGVSGDTSFEYAVSTSLPYYHSTNFYAKRTTNQQLEKITDKLNLDPQLAMDFKTLFTYMELWNEGRDMSGNPKVATIGRTPELLIDMFKKLDLPNMINHWHLFASYLLEHYNFYAKLEDIILNKPIFDNETSLNSINLAGQELQMASTSNGSSPKKKHRL